LLNTATPLGTVTVVVLPEVNAGAPGPGPLALPGVTWSGLALATGPGRCYHRCQ
jgi:hypothetical protein